MKQHFYLQDGEVINKLFGSFTRHAFADTCQVFGGDTELVGVEGYFPFSDAVFVHQCDEFLEDFILPTSSFYFLPVEVAVTLVIDIQHKRLEVIFSNLVAETIFAVVVYSGRGTY